MLKSHSEIRKFGIWDRNQHSRVEWVAYTVNSLLTIFPDDDFSLTAFFPDDVKSKLAKKL